MLRITGAGFVNVFVSAVYPYSLTDAAASSANILHAVLSRCLDFQAFPTQPHARRQTACH